MQLIFFEYPRVYQNIVEVGDNEYVEIFSQYVVNYILIYCRGVRKSKRYNRIFVISVPYSESCLLLFSGLYSYKVIRSSKVELSKVFSSRQSILKLANTQQQVSVLNSNIVQLPVLDIQAEYSVLFRYKEDRVSCR